MKIFQGGVKLTIRAEVMWFDEEDDKYFQGLIDNYELKKQK